MTNINNTRWRAFVKLTKADDNGDLILDVNKAVTLETDKELDNTRIYVGKEVFTVKETPDEICTLVDSKIDEQEQQRAEAFEAQRKAFEDGQDSSN